MGLCRLIATLVSRVGCVFLGGGLYFVGNFPVGVVSVCFSGLRFGCCWFGVLFTCCANCVRVVWGKLVLVNCGLWGVYSWIYCRLMVLDCYSFCFWFVYILMLL